MQIRRYCDNKHGYNELLNLTATTATQVFKMFHRAQFLVKQGDNMVAQRLLVRCLELNPFDSHR